MHPDDKPFSGFIFVSKTKPFLENLNWNKLFIKKKMECDFNHGLIRIDDDINFQLFCLCTEEKKTDIFVIACITVLHATCHRFLSFFYFKKKSLKNYKYQHPGIYCVWKLLMWAYILNDQNCYHSQHSN